MSKLFAPKPPATSKAALPDDYHLHTLLCRHADGSPEAYRAAAEKLGLSEICFTDHAPAPCGYDARYRMPPEQFEDYRAMIGALQLSAGPPRVLFGIEADYYAGCRDFLEHWLGDQNFDLVLGSVHYIGQWGFDSPENRAVWERIDIRDAWRDYYKLVGELADSGMFDVLAHPDLPKKFGHLIDENLLRELAAPALDRVAAAGMAVEINTAGLRKPVAEIYPAFPFLQLARERDIPITFGSDAHTPRDVGAGFAEAARLASAAGYRKRARFLRRRKTLVPLEDSFPSVPPQAR